MDRLPALATDVLPAPLPSADPRLRRRLRIMVGLLVLLVLMGINLAIGSNKLRFEKVTSESMEPSLLVNDVLLCDANAEVRRYGIVVADDPLEAGGELVKRVMGLPGDRILITGGVLYVKPLGETQYREEYSTLVRGNRMYSSDGRWTIPPDRVFLMGDNRNNSADSRDFGPVPIAGVRGVVSAVVWPPARWQRLRPYQAPATE
jgi:signal peptidase I